MEQENIMQDMMTMWEDAIGKVSTDPSTMSFNAQVADKLKTTVGQKPNDTTDVSKAVSDAAVKVATTDATTAIKALTTSDKQKMKKMKKESVFPTLLQWREKNDI